MEYRILTTIISPTLIHEAKRALRALRGWKTEIPRPRNMKKKSSDDLNDPQAFLFVRFTHTISSESTSSHEKIAFDLKDPFLMMMEAKRKRKKKEKKVERKKKDSLEFTDTTECLQWETKKSLLSGSSKRVTPKCYAILSREYENWVNKKICLQVAQFVSYPLPRLVVQCCASNFSCLFSVFHISFLRLLHFFFFSCCAYQKTEKSFFLVFVL